MSTSPSPSTAGAVPPSDGPLAAVDEAPAPARSLRLGVALVAGCVVAAEILLTRLFSVVVWYHFAFFAISLALLGTGAAALAVHVFQRRLAAISTEVLLALGALALGVTTTLACVVLLNTTPDWFGAGQDAFTRLTGRLLLVFLSAGAPFAAGGFSLAVAFARLARHAPSLYAWDLAGAALACLLVVPLLEAVGVPVALVLVSVAAVLAAAVLAPRRPVLLAALVLAVLGVGVSLRGQDVLAVKVAKGIDLSVTRPEYSRWNSFSLVTVLPSTGFRGWGQSPRYTGPFPEQKTLVIDMNAMTTLTRLESLEDARFASYDLSALAFRVHRGAEHVCVIGAGGGKDVLAALAGGARRVTGAEINPLIVHDVVRGRYRDFTGGLYHRPDVEVVAEDGRAFARRSREHFDVLLLSMVDTSASTAAGAYALTENSLYTSDAFVDFSKRLKPGGVLSVSSVSLPDLAVGARLVSVAREALRRGGHDPARSLAVVQTSWLGIPGAVMSNVLVKPAGFTAEEVAVLTRAAEELAFQIVYVPGRSLEGGSPEHRAIVRIATERSDAELARWLATLPLDVSPTTDERPFFFYQNRLAHLPMALLLPGTAHLFGNGLVVLSKVALISAVAVVALLFLPLALRREEVRAGAGSVGVEIGLTACLGVGFMLLEIGLIQRLSVFLGHPTSTLSVVLLVLLLGGAAGARWIAGRGAGPARRALLAVPLYALLLFFALGSTLAYFGALTLGGRALVAAAVVLPLGLLVGAPFPALLRAVSARAPGRLPWLWAVNAGTGVFGSVLATLVSLHAGIDATLLLGGAVYAAAFLLSRRVLSERSA